jgi:hypothetical protein
MNRTSTDVFDANGNTTFNGQQNVYDFENRLVNTCRGETRQHSEYPPFYRSRMSILEPTYSRNDNFWSECRTEQHPSRNQRAALV